MLAGNNIALQGKQVDILAADNESSSKHTVEQSSSGLTLALSGAVGSAINQAVTSANTANQESDSNGRMAALDGMKAALSGAQAYQASELAQANGSEGSMIGVNLSYGSQSSTSEQTQTSHDSQGSTIQAGNNLSINATDTDITVQGSQIKAGNNITLDAARDVNLISAENTHQLEGKNESQGGSVGVGVNFGSGSNGISVNASVNKGKGSETGNGTTHTETTIDAGNHLTINSGRDTTLTGAQISGDKVTLDVGRNLTLTSEKDSDQYDSKQQNASAGGSVSMGGGSGSVNFSQDKMHSDYNAVQEQSGIFAGSGGFDITVGEHTQLNGAVISSTGSEDKNRLDTGTLGFSNIDNHAEFSVEHQSAGISSSGSVGDQFLGNMANGLLVGAGSEGSADSTTKSAVSGGTIVIRDKDKQTQNVDDLSRDVANANPGLDTIFDKEKEQRRLQEIQAIGEIGSQAADVVRTQGEIAKQAALKDPQARQDAKEVLAGKGILNPTEEQINQQVGVTAMAPYGTGGSIQQGLQAITAVAQGLTGGNMGQALAGGLNPYIADLIHDKTMNADGTVNTEANAIAHAVWGAIASQASGNSAAAGAAGAVSGEVMARIIAGELYPGVELKDLSEKDKQTLSALGTLAAGLAGGLTGDSTADAIAGAQAGKNAVENNLVGGTESGQLTYVQEHGKDVLSCADAPDSASCQRGKAVNNAIAVALGGGAAGAAAVAVTPGIVAAAQAGVSACVASPVLCANEVSIWVAEMAAGDALPAGLTVATVSKMSASELSELKALMVVEKETGKKVSADVVEQLVKPAGKTSVVDANKFNYLFGKAKGNDHTLDRTNQLALEMKRLGVSDDINGHKMLGEHFTAATKDPGNIVKIFSNEHGQFEVRESFFIGPSGQATMFESTFKVAEDGLHSFITTIPKNGVSK